MTPNEQKERRQFWPLARRLHPTLFIKKTILIITSESLNSEHKSELKAKVTHLCEKSIIIKRHFHLTEDNLKENQNIVAYKSPSLDARQSMLLVEVPKLGKDAAVEALKEWGQPKSKITHLVFCSSSASDMPSIDYQLINLLGLPSTVKHAS